MPSKQSVVTSTSRGAAIFCVDVGSGSARAAYCAPGEEPVLLDNPNGAPNRRYHANEFSTNLYLSDPADPNREKVYRGEDEQSSGLVFWPAKFAIYRLHYKVDKLPKAIRDQYPHVSLPSCSDEEEKKLQDAIRRGWRQMFQATRAGLERHLYHNGQPFPSRLVVTIPPHWEEDLELCEMVCGLMGDVFPEVPRERITAWSEPEAILRQISTERWFHKKVFGDGDHKAASAIVCLIDCGGHNTGVVNCYLAFDRQTKHVTIIRLGNCLSGGGGGERWEWEVSELYNKMYLKANRDKPGFNPDGLTLVERQSVRDAFCVAKRTLNCATGENVTDTTLGLPNESTRTTICKYDLIETFNRAFNHPKIVATKALKQLAEHENPDKHVILCGGSAKNPGVQDMMKYLCLEAKLEPPISDAIIGTPRYNKHAQGGALIERDLGSHDVTPESYFSELGNVIAVQLGTTGTNGSQSEWWDNCSILYPQDKTDDGDDDGDEDEVPILMLNGSLHHGRKRLVKIICGRVGEQVPDNKRGAKWGGSRPKYLLGDTYDLLPEFQLERQGNWGVRLSVLPLDEEESRLDNDSGKQGDGDTLLTRGHLSFKLELLHRWGGTKWGPITKAACFTLHWSAGEGCLLLFDRNTSVEEAIVKMGEELEDHEYSLWQQFPEREPAQKKTKRAAARPRTAAKARGRVQKTTPKVDTAPVVAHRRQTRLATRLGLMPAPPPIFDPEESSGDEAEDEEAAVGEEAAGGAEDGGAARDGPVGVSESTATALGETAAVVDAGEDVGMCGEAGASLE